MILMKLKEDKILTEIYQKIRKKRPLIHCLTNYVTANDCANFIIACGGSPIMADDVAEVAEITGICQATVINIGTLNERTIEAMILAGKKANQLGHPVILDPVGVGASLLRSETVTKLLSEIHFSVIKGNISEIKSIYQGGNSPHGVDAHQDDLVTTQTIDQAVNLALNLSRRLKSIVVITGTIDIVAKSDQAYLIENGCGTMGSITGSGCMLAGAMGVYLGAAPRAELEAVVLSVAASGVCGERAEELRVQHHAGTASFRTYFIDQMSELTREILNDNMKITKVVPNKD